MDLPTSPEPLRICLLLFVALLFLPTRAFAQSFAGPEPEIDPDTVERIVTKHRGASWLSLGGYAHTVDGHTRDFGALATLELPFDRLAHRRTDPPRLENAAAMAPSGTFSAASLPVTRDVARAAVLAAWRSAGLGAGDGRMDDMATRARWSALFPEARMRVARAFDESARIDSTASGGPRTTDSAGANLWLEARLTWRLDRILYADDEPAFERIRFERHDARARIAARVLTLLGQWQRAWVDAHLSAADASESLETGLRLSDAEAALDVLTGSWFGRWRASLAVR
ncbi:hypothetical protein LVJ94_39985 [Pendulispora rubella]|uniref:Uncharacterized protein n=1 Tax=Pendulispora rubella TaxID=2741070 RepID=A0ABZ2KZS7_9BACT